MRKLVACGFAVALVWSLAWMGSSLLPENAAMATDAKKEPMLAHMVYFSLADNTPANREKLVAACQKYLTDHPGGVFFAAGTVADLNREVNDRDWDVGLHLVFKNRKAHDDYQVSARHTEFVESSKSLWKKVRVFDADCR